MLWRGGCIIRAQFLDRIAAAYGENATLENLMLAPTSRLLLQKARPRGARLLRRRQHMAYLHQLDDSAGILRWVSEFSLAGKSPSGTARLLRRAHV